MRSLLSLITWPHLACGLFLHYSINVSAEIPPYANSIGKAVQNPSVQTQEAPDEAKINQRLAYLRDPARSFEERLADFLVYTNLIPADKYLNALGGDRDTVLAMAREFSEIQWRHFESFDGKNLENPGEVDSRGLRAVESLVYAGDPETLRRLNRLWNENLALSRLSPYFRSILCEPDQPKVALIIGETLELGHELLDQSDDKALKAKLSDPKENERFLRAETASLLLAQAVVGDHQFPLTARAWFHDESRRFDDWYIRRLGNDETIELARMRWKHARTWYLQNKTAIAEGRYSEVRSPTRPNDSPHASIAPSKEISTSEPQIGAGVAAPPIASTPLVEPTKSQADERWKFWSYVCGAILVVLGALAIMRGLRRGCFNSEQ